MSNPIIIAIDAMGGENSPTKIIKGIEIHSLNTNSQNREAHIQQLEAANRGLIERLNRIDNVLAKQFF